jgi:hypothetical protein
MRDTRLIFIDGIPGSGKSTTAHRLYLHLQACRWDVTWYYEHDITHPIYRREEQKHFREEGFLDVDRLQPQIVSRWHAFAAVGRESPATTIMDGAFFQLPLGFMMLMNVGGAVLERHVRQVAAAVEPLAPVLVYFYQEDVRKSLAAVCELRRDASFAEQLTRFIASTPYGKSHRVQDLQGVADHYQDMRDKVLVLLDDLRMPKLTIESSAGDWQQYERQITEFLHLPELAAVYPLPKDTGCLAGRYRSGTGEELEVLVRPDGVFLNGQHPMRLIPKQDRVFCLEATCLEVGFELDDRGGVKQLVLGGNLEFPEREWVKVARREIHSRSTSGQRA